MSGRLTIERLGVRYGTGSTAFQALSEVDLSVEAGTFVTLLGPSGSGKTTLLRCIAGLITPNAGRIQSAGRLFYDASSGLGLPTRQRNLGMVFQAFALWPHMTVADNIAFPLRMRGWPRDRRRARVKELLELVELPGLGVRYPAQLSGGQQQRVGLARALACEPALLLMDEPLSSLDARLREEMRSSIRRLQKQLGITVIYVTHDREEALGLSDVIVILAGGRIMARGGSRELYSTPPDTFTATFLAGWSLLGDVNELAAQADGAWLAALAPPPASNGTGKSSVLLPMEIAEPLSPASDAAPVATGRVMAEVLNTEFLGGSVRIELRLPGAARSIFINQSDHGGGEAQLKHGDRVAVPVSAFRILRNLR